MEIQAPNEINIPENDLSVFLAGSIEMGKAEDWQKKIIKAFEGKPFTFLNPRRSDWDSTWEQKIMNPQFKEQVTWELEALEETDVIVMYFDPNTKSPISLLELGLHARAEKMIVLCPEGFWRKGNVDIVCELYGILQVDDFDGLIEQLKIVGT